MLSAVADTSQTHEHPSPNPHPYLPFLPIPVVAIIQQFLCLPSLVRVTCLVSNRLSRCYRSNDFLGLHVWRARIPSAFRDPTRVILAGLPRWRYRDEYSIQDRDEDLPLREDDHPDDHWYSECPETIAESISIQWMTRPFWYEYVKDYDISQGSAWCALLLNHLAGGPDRCLYMHNCLIRIHRRSGNVSIIVPSNRPNLRWNSDWGRPHELPHAFHRDNDKLSPYRKLFRPLKSETSVEIYYHTDLDKYYQTGRQYVELPPGRYRVFLRCKRWNWSYWANPYFRIQSTDTDGVWWEFDSHRPHITIGNKRGRRCCTDEKWSSSGSDPDQHSSPPHERWSSTKGAMHDLDGIMHDWTLGEGTVPVPSIGDPNGWTRCAIYMRLYEQQEQDDQYRCDISTLHMEYMGFQKLD